MAQPDWASAYTRAANVLTVALARGLQAGRLRNMSYVSADSARAQSAALSGRAL